MAEILRILQNGSQGMKRPPIRYFWTLGSNLESDFQNCQKVQNVQHFLGFFLEKIVEIFKGLGIKEFDELSYIKKYILNLYNLT